MAVEGPLSHWEFSKRIHIEFTKSFSETISG